MIRHLVSLMGRKGSSDILYQGVLEKKDIHRHTPYEAPLPIFPEIAVHQRSECGVVELSLA